jgi:hypothetical protein
VYFPFPDETAIEQECKKKEKGAQHVLSFGYPCDRLDMNGMYGKNAGDSGASPL